MKKKTLFLIIAICIIATVVGGIYISPTRISLLDGTWHIPIGKTTFFWTKDSGLYCTSKLYNWLTDEMEMQAGRLNVQQGEMLGKLIKNIIALRGEESPEIILPPIVTASYLQTMILTENHFSACS
jgi:hypothetical protein